MSYKGKIYTWLIYLPGAANPIELDMDSTLI